MKWILYILLAVGVAGAWALYAKQAKEFDTMEKTVLKIKDAGDPDGNLAKLEGDLEGKKGERLFSGILLTFLSAGLVGILFVVHVLPFFAQRLTHAVYDSGEIVQRDHFSGARSLMAQGEWEAAIAAFHEAAAADPMNRLPWIEIAKIYKDHLENPQAAIQTLRDALEAHAWEVNDAAYFMFRLAELYYEVDGNLEMASAIMNQVIEQFPQTRHSANAAHKLHEWSQVEEGGVVPEAFVDSSLEDEEAAVLARLRAAEAGESATEEEPQQG